MVFENDRFKVPITVGFRWSGMSIYNEEPYPYYYSTRKEEEAFFLFNFGIGFSLSTEFHFTKRFFLFGRVQGGLDFLYIWEREKKTPIIWTPGYDTETDRDYGFGRLFSINPQIGIGIRF
jgi:hypothetical protein